MPLPRYERLEPERRRALLDAAAAEFATHGHDGASLNAILARAGFGKSSYYYYFDDKDDLFATVVADRLLGDAAAAPTAVPADEHAFWAAFEAAYVGYLERMAADPIALGLARALQALRSAPPPRLAPLFERFRAVHADAVALGRSRGFVRTDLEVGFLVTLLEALDAAVDAAMLARAEPYDPRAHARLVVDSFRRILAPGEGRGDS